MLTSGPQSTSRRTMVATAALVGCVVGMLGVGLTSGGGITPTEMYAAPSVVTARTHQQFAATSSVANARSGVQQPLEYATAQAAVAAPAQATTTLPAWATVSAPARTAAHQVQRSVYDILALVLGITGLAGLGYIYKRSSEDRIAMVAASGKKGAAEPEPEDDGLLIGIGGTAANIVFYISLAKLFQTGCGLPAGPGGLYGLAEGLSYLAVPSIFGYSLYTKIQTGSGLPAGKFGLQGAAEGLSFLGIAAGIFVLISQITNFGFIPNAVPMDGGMCQ